MPNRSRARVLNGDPPAGSMPPADTGILRERVYNLERNVLNTQGELHEIRAVMATGEDVRQLQTNISAIASEMKAAISSISSEMRQSGKPQWQAISVVLTFCLAIGALVYWPIREKQSDQHDRIASIERSFVPERVHQREWQARDEAIKDLRLRTEKNQEALVRTDVFSQATQILQRQVDEIRRDVGGVVTTRDALQRQELRTDKLEAELRGLLGKTTNGRP